MRLELGSRFISSFFPFSSVGGSAPTCARENVPCNVGLAVSLCFVPDLT